MFISHRAFILAALAVGTFTTLPFVDAPAPCSCLIQPDKTVAVKPAPGRTVYCGLDVGSKTVKLSVVSMVKGQNATIKDERQCKRTLGMGALVFDSTTKTAKPLPAESIGYLTDTVKEYQRICTLDHGTMIAAGATQWARDATNTADKGSTMVSSILVAYGYVRGAVNDIEPAATYAAGRDVYQAHVKAMIEEELGKLSPKLTLASLRDLVKRGSIGPEIIALGQDGAVQLSARGLLKASPDSWIRDASAYDAVLTKQAFSVDPSFGVLTAPPIPAAELSSFFTGIQSADFTALTSEPIRTLYGQKALVVPALVDLLFRELGATRLVMVPQENTTGHMLSKLGRARP